MLQQMPGRMNSSNNNLKIPRHIIIKLLITEEKEKILKETREK